MCRKKISKKNNYTKNISNNKKKFNEFQYLEDPKSDQNVSKNSQQTTIALNYYILIY